MHCPLCPVLLALPLLLLAGAGAAGAFGSRTPPAGAAQAPGATVDPYVLDFTMKRIDGTEEKLSTYKGKVVVMVNVASKCGYTPQYTALEALYQKHKDKGLVILGFPANNFGSQEPGSNAEVAQFCTATYGVTFPLFEKISVKGEDQHPLYKKLAAQPAPLGDDPKWNFTKFVIDRRGNVVDRHDPKGDGTSRAALEPGLVKKVEELLAVSGG